MNLAYSDERYSADNFADQPITQLLEAAAAIDSANRKHYEAVGHLTARVAMTQLAKIDNYEKTLKTFNPFYQDEATANEHYDPKSCKVIMDLIPSRLVPEWLWDILDYDLVESAARG